MLAPSYLQQSCTIVSMFLFMAYVNYIIDASKKSKYTMFIKEITVSLECFDTFKAKDLSNSPAAESQSWIRKDWKYYKDHKTVFCNTKRIPHLSEL